MVYFHCNNGGCLFLDVGPHKTGETPINTKYPHQKFKSNDAARRRCLACFGTNSSFHSIERQKRILFNRTTEIVTTTTATTMHYTLLTAAALFASTIGSVWSEAVSRSSTEGITGLRHRDAELPLGGRNLYDDHTVLCRIVLIDTSYEDMDGRSSTVSASHKVCVPVVHGVEADVDFPIYLPEEMKARHIDKIVMGQLFVLVSPATFVNDTLTVESNAEYFVVDDRRLDHLAHRHLAITGVKTFALVRVSTSDSTPNSSLQELKDYHFGAGPNFVTQYNACSRGKLQWQLVPNGVIDVYMPNTKVTDYSNNVGGLTTAVQTYMKSNGYPNGVNAIADKVLMCLPPGTGTWAASAGINHWRVQMNNYWCKTLSATMRT
jgi:hypothetical protein